MAAAKQHLDFLSIMTYYYAGSWDTSTKFMAPWSDPSVRRETGLVGWPAAVQASGFRAQLRSGDRQGHGGLQVSKDAQLMASCHAGHLRATAGLALIAALACTSQGGSLDIEGTLNHYINVLSWPKG